MFLRRIFNSIPFTIGLLCGLYFIAFQVTGHRLTHFPGDFGDGRLNLYFLEHAYQFFSGKVESYWDAPFMYPEPKVISYSDNLLGTAPFYSFFRLFGMDAITSYQLWFIVLTILNYSTSYFLLKRLYKNNYAAVLGAMIFAFSIALQSQLTHAQTFPRFAIPLAILMAINFKNSLKPIYFSLCVFFVVYQIYCAIYLGLMLAIPIGIFLLVILLTQFKKIISHLKNTVWVFKIVGGIILNIILLLPLILPYIKRSMPSSYGYYKEILHTIPNVKSYFYSQQGSLFWDFLSNFSTDYIAYWDHQIFAGGVATLCFLLFLLLIIHKRFFPNRTSINNENTTFQLAIVALSSKFLFLRFGILSAYILIFFLPGYSAMRSITRIINVELIFFAIATAYVFSLFLTKKTLSHFALFLFFVGLITADNYFKEGKSYTTEKGIAYQRTKPLIELMEDFPKNSIISYEPSNIELPLFVYQIDAMLSAQATGHKTINAYTATSPVEYNSYWYNLDAASRNHWLKSTNADFDSLFVIKSPTKYEVVYKEEVFNN